MPTKAFSVKLLQDIWFKTLDDIKCTEVQKYLNLYIYKMIEPIGYAVWEYDDNINGFYFHVYPSKDLEETFIHNHQKSVDIGNNKHVEITLRKVFKNHLHQLNKFSINLNKSMFFEIKGQHYINLFEGIPYDLSKTINENIQKKVDFIWNHIKDIWCNRDEKQYKYVRKWIINMMNLKEIMLDYIYDQNKGQVNHASQIFYVMF